MSKMNVEKTDLKEQVDKKQFHMPRILIVYDMLVYLIAAVLLLVLYEGNDKLTTSGYLSTSSTFSRMHFRCQNGRKNLWTGMEIWRDPVLYPIAFDRCNCIHHLSVNGIMPAGRKDYICKNAFCVMSELTGSVSNPYVISLCI